MRAESIKTTAELLRQADAVLVGAGSGLSSAAGYNHYHHNAKQQIVIFRFRKFSQRKEFASFRGISGIFSAASHATTDCMKVTGRWGICY